MHINWIYLLVLQYGTCLSLEDAARIALEAVFYMSLGVVVWGGAERGVMHLNLISGIPPLFELHRLVLFVRCVLSYFIILILIFM